MSFNSVATKAAEHDRHALSTLFIFGDMSSFQDWQLMRISCDGAVTLVELNLPIVAQAFLTSDRVCIDKTVIERAARKGSISRWHAESFRSEGFD